MKNTNTTLAMVAVLAAVAMLSAGLAVPMQQASASNGGDDGDSIRSEVEQKNKCGGNEDGAETTCFNESINTIDDDDFPPGPPDMDLTG